MGNLEVSEKPISLVAEEQQLFDDPYQLDLTLQHHLVNQFQQKTLCLPCSWHIIFIINCLNWANRLTCTAIHTLIRLDIKHSIALINTINWALFNAGLILNINTRLRNYVGHASPYSYICLVR